MKILVPVDFYETSFSAYHYASQLAHRLDADITLLHVINGSFNVGEVIGYDPLLNMEDAALKRLETFAGEYASEKKAHLPKLANKLEVRFGIPGFSIADYANNYQFDLIIMGTRDKHGIFDKMLGSASTVAIRQAKCPVMLIHEQTRFLDPQKVVFAIDDKSDIEDSLEEYRKFNDILKAKTDFVHVDINGGDDLQKQRETIVKELFEDVDPTFVFEIKSLNGSELKSTLFDYCLFEKADMVALVHRKEGLFTNIFRKSRSIEIAQSFHLPVIVFQED